MLGMAQTFAAIQAAAPRVDLLRLLDYALRWPNVSTCQRLGVLLERAGIAQVALQPLAARVQDAGVAAMIRSAHFYYALLD